MEIGHTPGAYPTSMLLGKGPVAALRPLRRD